MSEQDYIACDKCGHWRLLHYGGKKCIASCPCKKFYSLEDKLKQGNPENSYIIPYLVIICTFTIVMILIYLAYAGFFFAIWHALGGKT